MEIEGLPTQKRKSFNLNVNLEGVQNDQWFKSKRYSAMVNDSNIWKQAKCTHIHQVTRTVSESGGHPCVRDDQRLTQACPLAHGHRRASSGW